MQGWAPIFTSLSGFLNFCTSAIVVLLGDDDVENYLGMSAAAYNYDAANGGKYFGIFLRHLFNVEIEDSTIYH